jgi:hypothetical protein
LPAKLVRKSVLDEPADQMAPAGTAPWARYFVRRAAQARHDVEFRAKALKDLLESLEEHEAWKPLGFASFSLLCSEKIGLSPAEVEALRRARNDETVGAVPGARGRPKNGKEKGDIITLIRGTTGAPYLAARLARDHSDILARLEAGEFCSVRAAAREAGIVRPTAIVNTDDPADAARQLGRWFQDDRRLALIDELKKLG